MCAFPWLKFHLSRASKHLVLISTKKGVVIEVDFAFAFLGFDLMANSLFLPGCGKFSPAPTEVVQPIDGLCL